MGVPTRLLRRCTRMPTKRGLPVQRLSLLQFEPIFPGVQVPGLRRDIRVRIAATLSEWEQAFRLVADNYEARGYDPPGSDLHFTPHHALPDTVVLVAQTAGQVVATFSLVADNQLVGLPLENLYGSEIRLLRRTGRRMFETISLADRDLGTREFVQVFMTMIQLAWQYGIDNGAETNVITVNPRHADFYTKVLGYVPLGPRRSYAQVQGHPAEALFLDPTLMLAKAPGAHQRVFGRRLPRQALGAPQMPADLVRHFAGRSSQTSPRGAEEVLRYVDQGGTVRMW